MNQIILTTQGNLIMEGSEAARVYFSYDPEFIKSLVGQTLNGVPIVREND